MRMPLGETSHRTGEKRTNPVVNQHFFRVSTLFSSDAPVCASIRLPLRTPRRLSNCIRLPLGHTTGTCFCRSVERLEPDWFNRCSYLQSTHTSPAVVTAAEFGFKQAVAGSAHEIHSTDSMRSAVIRSKSFCKALADKVF